MPDPDSPTPPRLSGEAPWGALLASGPADWQVLQRDADGMGRMLLEGTWVSKPVHGTLGIGGGDVQVRLVREENGGPVGGEMWRKAETRANGAWRAELADIPAGGPYRLETRFNPKGNKLGEWSLRGDMRHFLAVGDLWIVAGQSNAVGYGREPVEDPPETGLHLLRQDGRWALASHPLHDGTGTAFPASRENYNGGHSPFLHFARLLGRELGVPIGLIPSALGGSPLEAWHPQRGPLFRSLLGQVERAGGKVKGMIWCQGESDAEPGLAEDYLQRFLESVDGWRKALGDIPIVTVQCGRYRSRNPGEEDREWSRVREAQRLAPKRRDRLAVVPALDIPLDDTIHYSSAGNMVLAERLARAALAVAYGAKAEHRAPELVEAACHGDRAIELRFAPVLDRLDTYHPAARPFRVEDASGLVPVDAAVYYRRDTVRLHLERALQGTATVSCGYGEDPETLPVDVERRLPILACHAFPATPA